MLRVYACIASQHDPRLVVLAVLICLMSCATALSLGARARADSKIGRDVWHWCAAAVAGSGVWATHFVAMLAFRPGMPVGYDPLLTVASILVAVLGIRLGLTLRRLHMPILGGAVAGLAVAAMHFTGMRALEIQATQQWDLTMVGAAISIGVVFGAAGFQRLKSLRWRDCATALVLLSLAIAGLHFTAMAAVTFVPNPDLPIPSHAIMSGWLAVSVAAVTVLIVGLGLVGSIVDRHLVTRSDMEAVRLRAYVGKLEETRRNLEATTSDLQSALMAAEAANEAKSNFLAAMSHELRTPLNAVIGFASILKDGLFGPLGDERYQEYATNISTSGTHLLGIINDILELSKMDGSGGTRYDTEISVRAALERAVQATQRDPDAAGLTLEVSVEIGLPALLTDESWLARMLGHLLSNAVKFTPTGNVVKLAAFQHEAEIHIAVTDTGIGIAAEDIGKAFEPFGQIDSRLSRSYGGVGLGLPVTKHMIETQGGRLEFSSEPGIGTTVIIIFPKERSVARRSAA